MIANDDLTYKTRHIVGVHICCFYYTMRNKFTFPFIVPKYVTRYTFGKLYDWPIRIHVNERAGYMQLMRNHRYCHLFSHFVLCQFTLGWIISSFCTNISAN